MEKRLLISLWLCIMAITVQAQNITVKGSVISAPILSP